MKDPRERLVVALDVGGLDEAAAFVDRLGDLVLWYKVGLELFSAAGPAAVGMLKEQRKRVFLDLKLHDIPNTVGRAAGRLGAMGVDILDVHVAAGQEAMHGAARAIQQTCDPASRPLLLGVTVLTSTAVGEDGQPLSAEALVPEVVLRAVSAQKAGLDGVVCPAAAAPDVQRQCGADFHMLIPGIRLAGGVKADQRWTATPASAVEAGASWIVVGRPISAAPDPVAAAQDILTQIEGL
ncbi:MAG: orotidine-5'-phosphate decarboxylase [Candidatus Eisenbacteria sp.]|nr:orotidine-5'-phosphate decarboxylase [Candidatus Eisenbacteria bacterium]